jgi:dipeptidyl aminopeptidase/acylaminoacyl peptidase
MTIRNGKRQCPWEQFTAVRHIYGLTFSPDGREVAYITNTSGQFNLWKQSVEGGWPWQLTAFEDETVRSAAWAPNGKRFVFTADCHGTEFHQIYELEVPGGWPRQLTDAPPELPQGVIPSMWTGGPEFSPDGKLLAFYFASARRPNDLYVIDLEARELRRLTYSLIGNVPEEEMVEPELVRIPSFDGREVPAWLYKPQGLKAGERVPVVLSIHGGPEAQERPWYNYSGLYQYLLSRGIGVLAPNIRGSTGYGKTYQKLIHRDWGGGELKDLEACAKYLQSLDWVDSKRLGVFGGSFGGFATLSCATRLPDYWAAAVDIVGPSNLVTFAKAVPPFWKRYMKKWVGDPEEDYEFLMERSPITYVEQLKCPILIIQGANDPRVVKAESDQMVEKLRSLGRDVEYGVFEDEGHGFTKRKNELKAWRATAEFFEKHLLS